MDRKTHKWRGRDTERQTDSLKQRQRGTERLRFR